MCDTIAALDLLVAVLAVLKDNGLPLAAFKARVDPLSFGCHLGLELAISLDAAASGRADLDEGEFLLVAGMHFKKHLHCLEAFDDALGVVDAVDAHAKKGCFDAKFCKQQAAVFGYSSPLDIISVLKLHADRERTHPRVVVVPAYGKVFPIDPGFEEVVHRIEKVIAVCLDLEPDQVWVVSEKCVGE